MISIDPTDIARLTLRLRGLRHLLQRPAGVMRQVGQGVELQTRMRIYHEKADPEGNRWRPWSANYAKTRKPQHSLLIDTHDMVDSIDSKSSDQTATIFSDVFYAGYNQATRPFLGVSQQNASDIEQFLAPVLEELFIEALG